MHLKWPTQNNVYEHRTRVAFSYTWNNSFIVKIYIYRERERERDKNYSNLLHGLYLTQLIYTKLNMVQSYNRLEENLSVLYSLHE
jgi:DNA primase catalytic subunit